MGFRPGFLVGQTDLETALAPRSLVHAEQTFVDLVAYNVVERCAVVADDENDDANFLVGQEGNLGVKPGLAWS